jgi:hypothetical protein
MKCVYLTTPPRAGKQPRRRSNHDMAEEKE